MYSTSNTLVIALLNFIFLFSYQILLLSFSSTLLTNYSIVACMHGYYGKNCTDDCGNCFNNQTCNNVNGTCTDGCSEGFKGDLCKSSTVKIEPRFKDNYGSNLKNDILYLSTDACV